MLNSTLLDLAKSGASMIIDVNGMLSSTLISLAKECARSGAHLYLKNADKLLISTMKSIAQAADGHVTFDFTVGD